MQLGIRDILHQCSIYLHIAQPLPTVCLHTPHAVQKSPSASSQRVADFGRHGYRTPLDQHGCQHLYSREDNSLRIDYDVMNFDSSKQRSAAIAYREALVTRTILSVYGSWTIWQFCDELAELLQNTGYAPISLIDKNQRTL